MVPYISKDKRPVQACVMGGPGPEALQKYKNRSDPPDPSAHLGAELWLLDTPPPSMMLAVAAVLVLLSTVPEHVGAAPRPPPPVPVLRSELDTPIPLPAAVLARVQAVCSALTLPRYAEAAEKLMDMLAQDQAVDDRSLAPLRQAIDTACRAVIVGQGAGCCAFGADCGTDTCRADGWCSKSQHNCEVCSKSDKWQWCPNRIGAATAEAGLAKRTSGGELKPRRGGRVMFVRACEDANYQIRNWLIKDELGYSAVNREAQAAVDAAPLDPDWDLLYGGGCRHDWLSASKLLDKV